MDLKLSGRKALILGAGGFLGTGIVKVLASEGFFLIRSYSSVESMKNAWKTLYDSTEQIQTGFGIKTFCDVSEEDRIANLADDLNNIDCLVYNAGITSPNYFKDMDTDEWLKVLNVNLTGAFLALKHLTPKIRPGGSIVLISSVSSNHGSPTHANYSASKAGLHGLMPVVAKELVPYGIRINTIDVGAMEGGILNASEEKKALFKNSLTRRLGRPEDLGNLVAFLLSEKASYINNQVITLDGGGVFF
jgi:NAD(P)-dependent dehydrogenase (short-subunit alcohol dehydrogenase family)